MKDIRNPSVRKLVGFFVTRYIINKLKVIRFSPQYLVSSQNIKFCTYRRIGSMGVWCCRRRRPRAWETLVRLMLRTRRHPRPRPRRMTGRLRRLRWRLAYRRRRGVRRTPRSAVGGLWTCWTTRPTWTALRVTRTWCWTTSVSWWQL